MAAAVQRRSRAVADLRLIESSRNENSRPAPVRCTAGTQPDFAKVPKMSVHEFHGPLTGRDANEVREIAHDHIQIQRKASHEIGGCHRPARFRTVVSKRADGRIEFQVRDMIVMAGLAPDRTPTIRWTQEIGGQQCVRDISWQCFEIRAIYLRSRLAGDLQGSRHRQGHERSYRHRFSTSPQRDRYFSLTCRSCSVRSFRLQPFG